MGVTILNQTDRKIKPSEIRAFLKKVLGELDLERVSLSVVFVDPETIRDYNRTYRQTDAYTDVMAFPGEGDYLGDLVLCPQIIEENALEFGFSFEEELRFVLVHGVLHLLGYTDYTPEEKQQMYEKQREILRRIEDEEG